MQNRKRVAAIRRAARDLTSAHTNQNRKMKAGKLLLDAIDMELGLITNPNAKRKRKVK